MKHSRYEKRERGVVTMKNNNIQRVTYSVDEVASAILPIYSGQVADSIDGGTNFAHTYGDPSAHLDNYSKHPDRYIIITDTELGEDVIKVYRGEDH